MAKLELEIAQLESEIKLGKVGITEEKLLVAYRLILEVQGLLKGFKEASIFSKVVTGVRVVNAVISKIDDFVK